MSIYKQLIILDNLKENALHSLGKGVATFSVFLRYERNEMCVPKNECLISQMAKRLFLV